MNKEKVRQAIVWYGTDSKEELISKISKLDHEERIYFLELHKEAGYNFNKLDECKICSICGRVFSEWGNNAHPINKGTCCDDCNSFVIEERLNRN